MTQSLLARQSPKRQPSAALDKIQIRYRISYLTWLRMMAWKRRQHITMSEACDDLLNNALDEQGITRDPAVLLGLQSESGLRPSEGSPKGEGEEGG